MSRYDNTLYDCFHGISLLFPYEFLGLSLHDSFKNLIHGATTTKKLPDPSDIFIRPHTISEKRKDENDDRLVKQIIAGDKTTTACPACEYYIPDGEYEDGGFVAGDIVAVYDLKELLRCIIEITKVYKTTFGDIPEKLWKSECNSSAEEFRKDHISCWTEYEVNNEFDIMVKHFKLLEVIRET